jgi:pimeloyl-ACP methyl ester carboxylesterase
VSNRATVLADLARDAYPFAIRDGPLPDATPAEGPDPYGNPSPEWPRYDWEACLRRADVGGADIVYVEAGTGEPAVVFVHGLSGSWQNWLENIPHFARSRRVLALDLPGFGASPMPPWEVSIRAYGDLLHDFCEAVGVGDCVVVGNSMGGFVSAEATARDPERFEKLVLVSAAGISHARMRRTPVEVAARMAAAAAPIGLRGQERALLRPGLRYLAFRQIVHRPLSLRPELLLEQFHHGAAKPGFLPAVQGLVGYDFLDELEEVDVPTLIVWGREDRVVTSTDAAGYAQRLRRSQTVIFGDTGHMPQLERPVRFNRLLERFLDS